MSLLTDNRNMKGQDSSEQVIWEDKYLDKINYIKTMLRQSLS